MGRLQEIYVTLDRGEVAAFFLFMHISLKFTPSNAQTVLLGFRNTLRFVESGSGDDFSKVSGRSVKRETTFLLFKDALLPRG